MSLFDRDPTPAPAPRAPLPPSALDLVLTAQLVVAWAGEGGEEPRLGWWRSDLVSEFGGEDLFRRLAPATWRWATLQAAREAARRRDAELRRQADDPDRLVTLYRFGFEVDERIEERLQEHKRAGRAPREALVGLALLDDAFSRPRFLDWVQGHGEAAFTATPIGRRLDAPPLALDALVRTLVAALAPLADAYPLPHVRSKP